MYIDIFKLKIKVLKFVLKTDWIEYNFTNGKAGNQTGWQHHGPGVVLRPQFIVKAQDGAIWQGKV